jgi:hypothetical protein
MPAVIIPSLPFADEMLEGRRIHFPLAIPPVQRFFHKFLLIELSAARGG